VGLFKRKASAEELLRDHVERLGVSPFWLRSALDAIDYCERGEYFQPVFSVAGPAPARSVIALMRLEPFVRAEIDWAVSPSESPFWVGSLGDLHDELFDQTTERFVERYWSDEDLTAGPSFEPALRSMAAAVESSLREGTDSELDDETSRGVEALCAAGYVWRVAERAARTSDLNLRADLAKEIDAVVDSLPPRETAHEHDALAWAASECVRRDLLFGSGSPGGWAWGGEFLRRGFRFVDREVVPDEVQIPRQDRWYAFSLGVALYDVEECLARRPDLRVDPSRRQQGAFH
jgi:hypothetical protein